MGDYISRELTKEELVWVGASVSAQEAIDSVPSADVLPVVYSKWIKNPHKLGFCICEKCKCEEVGCQPFCTTAKFWKFCPACGATMREVVKE